MTTTVNKPKYRIKVDDKTGKIIEISYKINGKFKQIFTDNSNFTLDGEKRVMLDKEFSSIKILSRTNNMDTECRIEFINDAIHITRDFFVKETFDGFISSSLNLSNDYKYFYPLRAYDKKINEVESTRSDYLWALPLPAHIFYNDEIMGIYFIDKRTSVGTCDFVNNGDNCSIGFYYPDRTNQSEIIYPFDKTNTPIDEIINEGEKITFDEYIVICDDFDRACPLLDAEKIISKYLLNDYKPASFLEVADNIKDYYLNNQLFEKDALGKGKSWYRNMWKHTRTDNAEKDFYYDFGWGEGYGVITLSSLVRYDLFRHKDYFKNRIESLTNNMDLFLRNENERGAYYDRFIPIGYPTLLTRYNDYTKCDFLGFKRIWSHSLGMIAYTLFDLYNNSKGYDETLRKEWLKRAMEITDFFFNKQKNDGDIQDGFDENNLECNKKRHRIPARGIVCSTFINKYKTTKDQKYLDAAIKLSKAISKEILDYEFYNQMLDGHVAVINGEITDSVAGDVNEIYDCENSSYALIGLVDLYEITKDDFTLLLIKKCVSYLISWMYFYNIKTGVNGYSRGSTTCRMPDFPLCYIGAGNFAVKPLLKMYDLTNDIFYKNILLELVTCSAKFQWDAKDKPFDKAIVHAIYQVNGKHWGPSIEGQLDTGMTSGSTLLNLVDLLEKKVI